MRPTKQQYQKNRYLFIQIKQLLFLGFLVLMGFIGTWINGLMVDHFTAGLNARKRVCIISPKYQELQEFIVHELSRGVTLYEVTGGYSNEKKVELEAILTNDEFAKLMEKIRTEEIPVFMTSGRVSEIYGAWNQHKRKSHRHTHEIEN